METKYHFIAGLPRSGSTLLSTILNQNPRFYSGPSSPVLGCMFTLDTFLTNEELFLAYPKPIFHKNLISSVMHKYYEDVDKPVIFDKNRAWHTKIDYIVNFLKIENPKIICPVRNIDEILTSFITLLRRNPLITNEKLNFVDRDLVKMNLFLNDINRCEMIASGAGVLGQSFDDLKNALSMGYRKNIHFVEYNDLINNPRETLKSIYDFIGESYYEHRFDNLKNTHREKDEEVYGLSDMHEVRPFIKINSQSPKDILPKTILERTKGMEFWRET
jgi:sulfotransferase